MALVDLLELQQHALKHSYQLGMLSTPTIAIAKGVLNEAVNLDVPIILGIEASAPLDELMPVIELLGRRANIACAITAINIQTVEQAVVAIRYGCNGLLLDTSLSSSLSGEITQIAESCGIPLIQPEEPALPYFRLGDELEMATLQVVDQAPGSWKKLEERVKRCASDFIHDWLKTSTAIGYGKAALESCTICRPVEHLIIYNFKADDSKTEELAAEGRKVLDKIPGVRQTWSGYSVKNDASYHYCWLFRFANRKVIDSYRDHPDHIAYADNLFRPYAADRISIDYELTGTEEEK